MLSDKPSQKFSRLLALITISCQLRRSQATDPISLANWPSSRVQTVFDYPQSRKSSNSTKLCTVCSLNFGGQVEYENSTSASYFYDLSDKLGCVIEDFAGLVEAAPDLEDANRDSKYYLIMNRGECNFSNKTQYLFDVNQQLAASRAGLFLWMVDFFY